MISLFAFVLTIVILTNLEKMLHQCVLFMDAVESTFVAICIVQENIHFVSKSVSLQYVI